MVRETSSVSLNDKTKRNAKKNTQHGALWNDGDISHY